MFGFWERSTAATRLEFVFRNNDATVLYGDSTAVLVRAGSVLDFRWSRMSILTHATTGNAMPEKDGCRGAFDSLRRHDIGLDFYMVEVMSSSNQPAPGKAGIARLLTTIERHCPGLPEPGSGPI